MFSSPATLETRIIRCEKNIMALMEHVDTLRLQKAVSPIADDWRKLMVREHKSVFVVLTGSPTDFSDEIHAIFTTQEVADAFVAARPTGYCHVVEWAVDEPDINFGNR